MVLTDLGDDIYAFTISVDKAALLLTLDQGRDLDGVIFSDEETRPFEQPAKFVDASGRENSVWRDITEMLEIEPKGRMLQTRDRLLALLAQGIEKRDIKPDRLRRTLDGTLDPANTLLDLGALADWAEVHGIETGDLLHEFEDDEAKLIENMRSLAFDWQDRAAVQAVRREMKAELEAIPEAAREEMVRLLAENARLRADRQAPRERPMSKRAYDSLLKVIAAMAYDCYRDRIKKPWSLAKDVQAAAQQLGLDLSDDTIAAKLKDAVALIPPRPLR